MVQVLVATINQKDTSIIERMNISSDAIIANQADDEWKVAFKEKNIFFVTTKTKGVGVNRNIALDYASGEIIIFADDDFIFKTDYQEIVKKEFEKTKADIIIFNFLYHEKNGVERYRISRSKRLRLHNALRYGACAMAIKLDKCREYNLHFSALFGGGSRYGSGEDSLFLLNCLQKGLKVFASEVSLGDNYNYESTWFSGYNRKYFHDKGAWVACAFPKIKHLIKLYYVIRFIKVAECSNKEILSALNEGIKDYKRLTEADRS